MLTLLPTLLAVLGTLLMAVVIFAPNPAPAPRILTAERYSPLPFEAFGAEPALPDLPFAAASAPLAAPSANLSDWPAHVDPCAAACDAEARLALVQALEIVRGPWANSVLRYALGAETDPRLRAAIAAAIERC